MSHYAFAGILIIVAISSAAQRPPSAPLKVVAPLGPVMEVLGRANVPASVEVSDHCDDGRPVPRYFPSLRDFPRLYAPKTIGDLPIQRLREMLEGNPNMRVTQDRGGMVRLIENDISTDLLNVKISHISIEIKSVPLQGSPDVESSALLRAILSAPEVVAFMQSHGVIFPFNGQGGSYGIDSPNDHAKPFRVVMDSVTVAEALDQLVKMFPGIWLYENCLQRNGEVVGIWFFDFRSPGPYVEK